MVIEGPTDTAVFRAYVENVLIPTLRPGDIVALDNLSPHKQPEVIAVLEHAGAQVWSLPPYSPDFNPIEKMWSKIKAHLRKIKARSPPTLLRAISSALHTITASDAEGWFNHCGYRYSQS
jgi:transposase